MRKKIFLFNTSYPFLLFCLLCILTTQTATGQADLARMRDNQRYSLRPSPVAQRDSLLPDLGFLARSSKAEEIPGPFRLYATPVAVTGASLVVLADSIAGVNSDADSLDNRDATATSQSLLTPGALAEAPGTGNPRADKPAGISNTAVDEETDLIVSKYAEMISVTPEEVNNRRLYKFIDQWYGVKYKWGGSDLSGIDCSGFSRKLYSSIYNVTLERTARQQHHNAELIKEYVDASEGDLVFFRIHHLGISHVGVYLANGFFVHASRSGGVTISNLDDKYWRRRYAGCGKVEREAITGSESGLVQ